MHFCTKFKIFKCTCIFLNVLFEYSFISNYNGRPSDMIFFQQLLNFLNHIHPVRWVGYLRAQFVISIQTHDEINRILQKKIFFQKFRLISLLHWTTRDFWLWNSIFVEFSSLVAISLFTIIILVTNTVSYSLIKHLDI